MKYDIFCSKILNSGYIICILPWYRTTLLWNTTTKSIQFILFLVYTGQVSKDVQYIRVYLISSWCGNIKKQTFLFKSIAMITKSLTILPAHHRATFVKSYCRQIFTVFSQCSMVHCHQYLTDCLWLSFSHECQPFDNQHLFHNKHLLLANQYDLRILNLFLWTLWWSNFRCGINERDDLSVFHSVQALAYFWAR